MKSGPRAVYWSFPSETAEGANAIMYTLLIRAEVDAAVIPYELTHLEQIELTVESAVACALQALFVSVDMKEVSICPSSREVERDWDSLLAPDQ